MLLLSWYLVDVASSSWSELHLALLPSSFLVVDPANCWTSFTNFLRVRSDSVLLSGSLSWKFSWLASSPFDFDFDSFSWDETDNYNDLALSCQLLSKLEWTCSFTDSRFTAMFGSLLLAVVSLWATHVTMKRCYRTRNALADLSLSTLNTWRQLCSSTLRPMEPSFVVPFLRLLSVMVLCRWKQPTSPSLSLSCRYRQSFFVDVLSSLAWSWFG